MSQEEFEKLMREMHEALEPKYVIVEQITQTIPSCLLGMFEVSAN